MINLKWEELFTHNEANIRSHKKCISIIAHLVSMKKNDDFIFICESRDAAFYAFFSIEFHTLIVKKNVKWFEIKKR